MSSLLSLIVAKLFMKYFETNALTSVSFHPKKWKRFVDDNCDVWPHGHEKLDLCLHHPNSQSESIKFTIEVEFNELLPFLYILLSRMDDGYVFDKDFLQKN